MPPSLRLLVVTQYFWPENFRINELVAELSARGHDVTVLTGWPNYPEGKIDSEFLMAREKFSHFGGAEVVRVPLVPRGSGAFRLILNYLSFAIGSSVLGLWKLRGKAFDAVFVYEPSPITVGIPGAVMRYAKRAPLALWVLDLWPDTLQAVGVVRSTTVLRSVGWLVSWIYRRCDLILVQSRSFVSQIAHYAPATSRIEYFPAWADDVFRSDVVAEPDPSVPSAPEAFTVLFAGNIGEAQDFPAILDAAERLRDREDIRWLLVGDGRMSPWVASQIEQRKLTGRILMVGRHSLDRMPAFFAHADALLVSLKDEPAFSMTIPGKLQAYLSSGIPIVAMLNGEGADVVVQSDAGLVSPAGDARRLAENISRLADMRLEDLQRLGENGRRFSNEQFDFRELTSRLEGWLQGLAEPNRSKRC